MPATLLSGTFLPVSLPPVDPRTRVRPIPEELQPWVNATRGRDMSDFERAMHRIIMDLYQPPREWFLELEERDRMLGEAINPAAEASFAPMTTFAESDADEAVATDTWGDISALELEIVVPIPARLYILLVLDARCDAPSSETLESRVAISDGMSANVATGFVRAAQKDLRYPMVSQALVDLEPATLYTLTGQARTSATGLSQYTILTGSTLSCRVEARSLIEE